MSTPEPQSLGATPSAPRRSPLKLAMLVVVVAILVAAFLLRDQLNVAWFRTLGYAGVFLMALIGSSTILLPIPHLAFTFTMGAVLNPWLTGLSAGIGDALGEITGYIAGYAVEDVVAQKKLYVRLKKLHGAQRRHHHLCPLTLPRAFFRSRSHGGRAGGLSAVALHAGDICREDDQGVHRRVGRIHGRRLDGRAAEN
jgi:membrane protein YqaA with SNARE-associated domain